MTEQKSGCGAILASINKRRIEWRNARRVEYYLRTKTEIEIQPVREGSLASGEITLLQAELSKHFHNTAPRATGIYTTANEAEIKRILKKLGLEEKAVAVSISKRPRN